MKTSRWTLVSAAALLALGCGSDFVAGVAGPQPAADAGVTDTEGGGSAPTGTTGAGGAALGGSPQGGSTPAGGGPTGGAAPQGGAGGTATPSSTGGSAATDGGGHGGAGGTTTTSTSAGGHGGSTGAGGSCEPTSCFAENYPCGKFDDGCGTMLDCGPYQKHPTCDYGAKPEYGCHCPEAQPIAWSCGIQFVYAITPAPKPTCVPAPSQNQPQRGSDWCCPP